MGLYLKKSVKVGPFRFNLSKSGVGISAGVKGFRVGTSPRGNYIHMGAGGIYYRTTLPRTTPTKRSPAPSHPQPSQTVPHIPDGTVGAMVEIDSASVDQIVDASSETLLAELREKQRKPRLWPWALALSLLALAMAHGQDISAGWSITIGIAGAGLTWLAYSKDVLRKTTVLMYDFDAEMENLYEQLHDAAAALASCAKAWHVEASARVHDSKYHAGAGALVQRKPTSIRRASPPFLKTNIETVAIGVGKQTLYFFPDRVFIFDGTGVGAVGYADLNIDVGAQRFIESEAVPGDAQVVDKTWRFVNKKGGPDRRFNNNRELPVCLYEEIHFRSPSGVNELIQVSKVGQGKRLKEVVTLSAARLAASL